MTFATGMSHDDVSFNSVDLGHRRAAKVQEHVGALLSGSQCNRVSVRVSV